MQGTKVLNRKARRALKKQTGKRKRNQPVMLWQTAGDLKPGNQIVLKSGETVTVEKTTRDEKHETVYNFEVVGDHSYFVGETGVWVHNDSGKSKTETANPQDATANPSDEVKSPQDLANEIQENIDKTITAKHDFFDGGPPSGVEYQVNDWDAHLTAGAQLTRLKLKDGFDGTQNYDEVVSIIREARGDDYLGQIRGAERDFDRLVARTIHNTTGGKDVDLGLSVPELIGAYDRALDKSGRGDNLNTNTLGSLIKGIGIGKIKGFDNHKELAVNMLGQVLLDENISTPQVFGVLDEINSPTLRQKIQLGLDVIGLVPVFGEVADVINAGIYAVNGEYGMAALSVAATAPVLGAAATGGKLILKGAAKVTAQAKAAGVTVTEAIAKAAGRACFASGTLILTKEGHKPIETIQEGDLVWSRSEFDEGESTWRKVLKAGMTGEKEIYEVSVSNTEGTKTETYRTTELHPFWSDDRGVQGEGSFVAAADMRVGERLRLQDGSPVYVTEIRKTEKIEPVFNLTVDGFHTYYVGELGVWVHNECLLAALRRLNRSGHAVYRHGGRVTDKHLSIRATTGRAPDGFVKYKANGDPIIPKFSTAFHSDEMLVFVEQSIRQNHLDDWVKAAPIDSKEIVKIVDFGTDIGRGIAKGGGPVEHGFTSAKIVLRQDSAGIWQTYTLFPVKK